MTGLCRLTAPPHAGYSRLMLRHLLIPLLLIVGLAALPLTVLVCLVQGVGRGVRRVTGYVRGH